MKINIATGTASIWDARGDVWHEHFSYQEADDLADFLNCLCQNSVPEYLLPAYERFTNILRALTNDSDACIVTAG